MSSSTGLKKMIKIDVVSDLICPWCFVGKKRLEKAMEETKHLYIFEVKWHPYMLNPSLPKEGKDKNQLYRESFGVRYEAIVETINQAFQTVGYRFGTGGLIGSTQDGHRLIELAGRQGLDKQNILVETLMIKALTQDECVSHRQVLLSAAESAGIEGAKEWIDDPNAGLKEIQTKMATYAHNISGVPNYKINGKYDLSGAQDPQTFIQIFKKASQNV
ncbi:uncharacterized protein LOC131050842 [Cryptomeria japonica]|uniref:uncharacterized protein LOC131050842 n=1 Tax=Cryptomeria japonica TaxID=3369 RepID=UPI0027DA1603|nr:uncharacterized protein LOC131050842 [Cryptomeria japonica]XP_057841119.2 uncharacterized protein LOC131050842 [Cryptomeria japonica]